MLSTSYDHYALVRTIHYPLFFFNDTATTEIYTLSLHDALPICDPLALGGDPGRVDLAGEDVQQRSTANVEVGVGGDRKSTRLNSSHSQISYAVFCLKKKKTAIDDTFHPHSAKSTTCILGDGLCR